MIHCLRVFIVFLCVTLFWELNACTSGIRDSVQKESTVQWYNDTTALRRALNKAIEDAQVLDESKVSHTLMPLDESVPEEEWIDANGTKMVLVLTMLKHDALKYYAKDTFELNYESGIWVTIPADWKRRHAEFEGMDSVESRMRMVQMLGMGVNSDLGDIVEFYADAKGLFRPAHDPDITTNTSPIVFPESVDSSVVIGVTNFRKWFANQLSTAYKKDSALPWTQLGYTYDWHEGATREGLSEYIVSHQTKIIVKRRIGSWTFIKDLLKGE